MKGVPGRELKLCGTESRPAFRSLSYLNGGLGPGVERQMNLLFLKAIFGQCIFITGKERELEQELSYNP